MALLSLSATAVVGIPRSFYPATNSVQLSGIGVPPSAQFGGLKLLKKEKKKMKISSCLKLPRPGFEVILMEMSTLENEDNAVASAANIPRVPVERLKLSFVEDWLVLHVFDSGVVPLKAYVAMATLNGRHRFEDDISKLVVEFDENGTVTVTIPKKISG